MTLSSAYIELFIRGKSSGEMSGENVRIPFRTIHTTQEPVRTVGNSVKMYFLINISEIWGT